MTAATGAVISANGTITIYLVSQRRLACRTVCAGQPNFWHFKTSWRDWGRAVCMYSAGIVRTLHTDMYTYRTYLPYYCARLYCALWGTKMPLLSENTFQPNVQKTLWGPGRDDASQLSCVLTATNLIGTYSRYMYFTVRLFLDQLVSVTYGKFHVLGNFYFRCT